MEPALHEPSQPSADIHTLADPQLTAAGRQPLAAGRGLHEAVNAGRDQTRKRRGLGTAGRRRSTRRSVSGPAARISCFKVRSRSAWISSCKIRSPGSDSQAGKRVAASGENKEKVVAERVDLVLMRTHDDQRSRRRARQLGGHQRARRSPDSVERRRLPSGQGRHHIGEAFVLVQRRASSRKRSDAAVASDEPDIFAKRLYRREFREHRWCLCPSDVRDAQLGSNVLEFSFLGLQRVRGARRWAAKMEFCTSELLDTAVATAVRREYDIGLLRCNSSTFTARG